MQKCLKQPMSLKPWLTVQCLGLRIAVAVGATLLAFVSVIAMLNGMLGWSWQSSWCRAEF